MGNLSCADRSPWRTVQQHSLLHISRNASIFICSLQSLGFMSLILKWFIRSKMTPQGWFPYKYAEIQIPAIPANGCYWGVWPTWCLQRAALLWAQRQKEKSSLQGVAIWERDITVHGWPWEISGMFRSGCEKPRVIEKTFLIKSINLMESHCKSSLTHCWDPASDEGAAVAALWVEGGTLPAGPSL